MRISFIVVVVVSLVACSGAEPARPYAPELDPASPNAQEPAYRPPANPLTQPVASASASAPPPKDRAEAQKEEP